MKNPRLDKLYLCLACFILPVIVGGCAPGTASNAHPLCFSCDSESCYPVEVSIEDGTGLFDQGKIDLTGDGVAEQVQRVGEQVTIYQDGVEAWRSPPEWRVIDVALGDPNDDGRGEVLVAFWKQDDAGVLRCHPFVVGYRGGYYREMWGGSAVDVPIREVELADVDGDGTQELIVLEEVGNGTERAIAVWQWNQWWFNIAWRSPKGTYRNLRLASRQSTERSPLICITTE